MPSFLDALAEGFQSFGGAGVLVALFFLFLIDALVFPTLPEVFAVLLFTQYARVGWEPLPWAVFILAVALAGEIAGLLLLYGTVRSAVVKRGAMPRRLDRAMAKYVDFLLVKDERMVLVNRVAPALPFVGAFAAVRGWDIRKVVAYAAIGGLLKYPVLLALAWFFGYVYDATTAQIVTIVMVASVVALSAFAGWRVRKRALARKGLTQ